MIDAKELEQMGIDPTHAEKAAAFKKKMFRIKLVIWLFVIALFIGLFFLFKKWDRDGEEKQFQDALLATKMNFLEGHSKMHYSIDVNGHTVNIKMWLEGLTEISKKAYYGGNESWDEWNTIKDSMSELSHELYKEFILVDDAVVYLRIVNENNTDRDLLVYKDKYMVYDVVTGIGG